MNKFFKEQPEWKSLVVIFMVSAVLGINNGVNSLLSKLMVEFPDISQTNIRLLSTLVNVVSTGISLLTGPLVGRKIGYRPLVFTGLGLALACGILPAFANSYGFLLFARVLFGIGLGLCGCRAGYIVLMAAKGTETKMSSNFRFFYELSGVVMAIVMGYLGDINWRYGFFCFALVLVPMILGLGWMKEPAISEEVQVKKSTGPVAGRTWLYAMFVIILASTSTIWISGASQVLVEKGFESSGKASLVISAITLGAVCSAFVFRFLDKINQRIIAPIACLANAVACFVAVIAKSVPVIIVCGFIAGCGYVAGVIMCTTYAALSNKRENVTKATIIITAFQTGGSFLAAYYIALCGGIAKTALPQLPYTTSAFAVSACFLTLLAIVTFIINMKVKKVEE